MYYVIQVLSHTEDDMVDLIKKNVSEDICFDVFIPRRKKLKKYEGGWHEVIETLFPRYIFVDTDNPNELYKRLYFLPGFTKLLGIGKKDDIYFMPLSKSEAELIDSLADRSNNRMVDLSEVSIDESITGKKVEIISGPLIGQTGNVIKIDLHKREATLEISMAGRICNVKLGINIIRKKD